MGWGELQMSFIAPPALLAQIRPAVWGTRPSKVMLSTVSVSVVEVARGPPLRVLPMGKEVQDFGVERAANGGLDNSKPTNQGINQLKYQRSLRSTAEERVGRRCANLRVLSMALHLGVT